MKKVVTTLILVLSAVGVSAAYAQGNCMKVCEEDEKQCIRKNSKMDFWGNRIVTPEGEKTCLENAKACRRACIEQLTAK